VGAAGSCTLFFSGTGYLENNCRFAGRFFNQYGFYQETREVVENNLNSRFIMATNDVRHVVM
jgi:hypothetical protein